ncbi:Cof-type HAD-IIB family hydrolase [Bacillus sp. 28A-2]|uniref:HAD family hydrolase n=1 Tax=Bacillus sp. 28A-2 TaxID=2772252 RepID=UPI00168D8F09|nr:Cof-type HAD-IIB family hydrolase [Bacillus sp. 28A-2]MBD3861619.1 Cof-type HAD-IIB family hydrolase [Bacillus sp. 28A-2]
MIKLIITDLDGTFLNRKGDYDREFFQSVKNLMVEKNVAFAPCTGKQCERVEALFGQDAKDFWILGDSATRIKKDGKFVYQSLIQNGLGLTIIKRLEEISLEHTVIACTQNGAVVKKSVSEDEMRYVNASYSEVVKVDSFEEINDDFVKITIHDPYGRCVSTKEKLNDLIDQVYIVASEDTWIDISNFGVHKGTTVKQLQKMLGVTKEETMAFGDGRNDLELMDSASYSFAVRNAIPEVKEAAHFITRSNEESGVLKAIEKILNLQ